MQDLLGNNIEDNDRDLGCGKIFIGPNLGQKGAKRVQECNFWPYYPNASFLLFEIWQHLLENDFKDNDQDFGCGRIFIGPNLGQKGGKRVRKCNFWLCYLNAFFLLLEIWQDVVENNFEDNDRDLGCGKIFVGPNLGQKGAKRVRKCNFWPCYPNA